MSIFPFLKAKPKCRGLIGYYGLTDWWFTEFTEKERAYIQKRYRPVGSSYPSLTKGDIRSRNQSVIGFFSGLVTWFSNVNDRSIAHRIITKAEEFIDQKTDPLDAHFLYGIKIQVSCKDRDLQPDGLQKAIAACKQQISISEAAAAALKHKYRNPLPGHTGFEQLSIIMEKQKEYQKAISIAEEAQRQGWTGAWEKTISRCRKKLQKTDK